MDEINQVQGTKEPKNNQVLFFVVVIVLLVIIVGGYMWWKSGSDKNRQGSEQKVAEEQNRNQSVLSFFGLIKNIEGNNITIYDAGSGQTATFVRSENTSVTKENIVTQGFDKISFAELKTGQTVNLMYQNDQTKTPLSIVVMGGTNIAGEVIETSNDQITIKNQTDTYTVKFKKQTSIVRLGDNGKMENNLSLTEIKKGNYVTVTAENRLQNEEKIVEADKIEILSQ
ncbi:MAG: hypothetical protein ACOZAR_02185 [Patescibacteria group bacterium]